MHIAAEINWGKKEGGSRRVSINLLLEMIKLAPQNTYTVYCNTIYPEVVKEGIKCVKLDKPRFFSQTLWDQFLFPHYAIPVQIKKDKPDIFHFTNNLHSFGLTFSCPTIVTIHDMIPFIMPESFYPFHTAYMQYYFHASVKKARHIITVSESSRSDICNILKIDPSKISVVYNASNLSGKILQNDYRNKFGKHPYLFYAGAIHPRKNVNRIIDAFAQIKDSKKIPHRLLLAGSFRWGNRELMNNNNLKRFHHDIIFTGPVSDDELIWLYKNCTGFIFPSLYEGFGLPVIEAMSLGAPVITSNSSSLPEVAGEAALFVDPKNTDNIAEAILRVINNEELREDLRVKGLAQSAKFSWKKSASQLLSIYEEMAKK